MKVPLGGIVALLGGGMATYLDFWNRLGWWGSFVLVLGFVVFWVKCPSPEWGS